MSLGSGIVFGSLIGYGAYRTSANPKDFMFLFGQCFGRVGRRLRGEGGRRWKGREGGGGGGGLKEGKGHALF